MEVWNWRVLPGVWLAAGLLVFSCTTTTPDEPGEVAVEILVGQALGLASDLIRYKGGIPIEAADTVIALRQYGESLCSVVVDGEDPARMDEPRRVLDEAYAEFTSHDIVLYLLVSRAVDTARQVADLALLPNADPEKLRAPCERLRTLPVVLPRDFQARA